MKIIYEVGDFLELEDSTAVPYELGACSVSLKFKHTDGRWSVEVEDGFCDTPIGEVFIINEKWFVK